MAFLCSLILESPLLVLVSLYLPGLLSQLVLVSIGSVFRVLAEAPLALDRVLPLYLFQILRGSLLNIDCLKHERELGQIRPGWSPGTLDQLLPSSAV